jgi:formylglycine-generating enzyme required for sulfatase activity
VFQTSSFSFESLTLDRAGQVVARTPGAARLFREDLGGGLALDLVWIPGGIYQMGTPGRLGYDDEHPLHPVSVGGFWLGRCLVSQAQWRAVTGKERPFRFKGDQRPVEQVSWEDALAFCRRLGRRSGRDYRLPCEAEWEFACRAGTATPFSCGETITTDLANYVGEHTYAEEPKGVYRHGTTAVGSFPPNPFGLSDMHGNVWEWCADAWFPDYTGAPANAVPRDHPGALERVVRGGSWHETPNHCRSAVRLAYKAAERDDFVGFRIALSGDGVKEK